MAKDIKHSKKPKLNVGIESGLFVKLNGKVEKKRLSFSFRYFRQIENFGISGKNDVWMSGLLQQLALLSDKDAESLLSSYAEKTQLRLHPLDLSIGKSALSLDDFSFIDKRELPDGEENKFWQIEISKANGRIIGFFSADHLVFFIVFLDPNHNAQLSNFSDYKIRKISPCMSELDDLKARIAKHVSLKTALEEDSEDFIFGEDKSYICLDSDLLKPIFDMVDDHTFIEKLEAFLFDNL